MITAAIETFSISTPISDMPKSANITVKGTMQAMTKAARMPRKASITSNTTPKVCATFESALSTAAVIAVS